MTQMAQNCCFGLLRYWIKLEFSVSAARIRMLLFSEEKIMHILTKNQEKT